LEVGIEKGDPELGFEREPKKGVRRGRWHLKNPEFIGVL
jgi:hypothetical protein